MTQREENKPEGIELDFAPYIITEDGKVWSIRKNRYLKPSVREKGYCYQYLTNHNGKGRFYCIHRLVAVCYIPNPNNLPEVNHKDLNKGNNHKDNLEWMTHKDNIQHSYDSGRITPSGSNHWNYGKSFSNESKALMSEAKKGENHPKFKGYYSYNGLISTSLNDLAKLMNVYAVKANRMYMKGLIQFNPKSL